MNWIEGQPDKEGLYWVHDAVNGVLFGMIVHIQEEVEGVVVDGLYYYVMGCEMGFPVDQLTHYIQVKPPTPPAGTSHVSSLIVPE